MVINHHDFCLASAQTRLPHVAGSAFWPPSSWSSYTSCLFWSAPSVLPIPTFCYHAVPKHENHFFWLIPHTWIHPALKPFNCHLWTFWSLTSAWQWNSTVSSVLCLCSFSWYPLLIATPDLFTFSYLPSSLDHEQPEFRDFAFNSRSLAKWHILSKWMNYEGK